MPLSLRRIKGVKHWGTKILGVWFFFFKIHQFRVPYKKIYNSFAQSGQIICNLDFSDFSKLKTKGDP